MKRIHILTRILKLGKPLLFGLFVSGITKHLKTCFLFFKVLHYVTAHLETHPQSVLQALRTIALLLIIFAEIFIYFFQFFYRVIFTFGN
jgi:hypothetical protein